MWRRIWNKGLTGFTLVGLIPDPNPNHNLNPNPNPNPNSNPNRLNGIHVYGVDCMSTGDIMKHFEGYCMGYGQGYDSEYRISLG